MTGLNLPVGYIFGEHDEFQVIRRQPLSEGVHNTFAEVYLVKKIKVRKKFALKVLRPEIIAKSARSVDDFQDEIRVLMSLDHKNIIRVEDYGTLVDRSEIPSFYLVMEYVENGSMLKEIYSAKKMLFFFLQILEGLEYIHGKNILHRDIKPDNILIEHDIVVKITDFGIVKVLDSEHPVSSVIGAPAYAPPEQNKRLGHLSFASDLYAAGKTLYTMLTGEIPEINKQITTLPENVRTKPWGERVESIIRKATSYDPRLRYQTADEMRKDIKHVYQTCFQARGAEPVKVKKPEKTYRSIIALLAVLFISTFLILYVVISSKGFYSDAGLPEYRDALRTGIAMFHDKTVPLPKVDLYFDEMMRKFNADAAGLLYAAWIKAMLREPGFDEKLISRTIESEPERDDLKIAFGKLYYEKGDLVNARQLWHQAGQSDEEQRQTKSLLRLTGVITP